MRAHELLVCAVWQCVKSERRKARGERSSVPWKANLPPSAMALSIVSSAQHSQLRPHSAALTPAAARAHGVLAMPVRLRRHPEARPARRQWE